MDLLKKKMKDKAGTLWCIFLIFLWIFPYCYNGMEKSYYIGLVAFFVSAAAVEFIKNKAAIFLIHVFTTVIGALFDINYVFLAFPALMILTAHTEAMEYLEKKPQKSKESVNLYVTVSMVLSVVIFFYSIICCSESVGLNYRSIRYELVTAMPLHLFFLMLIIKASKKEEKSIKSKNLKNNFLLIYCLGLTGLFMTEFYCFSVSLYNLHRFEETLQYWFFTALIIGKRNDPFLKGVIDSAEAFLKGASISKAK